MEDRSAFFEQVYQVVRQIPPGRVTSYGAIARFLGSARSSRMVGYAMNNSHVYPDVPAHRVVNRVGLLTGKHHFGPPGRMAQLLAAEGIVVEGDQICNFGSHFWSPEELLK